MITPPDIERLRLWRRQPGQHERTGLSRDVRRTAMQTSKPGGSSSTVFLPAIAANANSASKVGPGYRIGRLAMVPFFPRTASRRHYAENPFIQPVQFPGPSFTVVLGPNARGTRLKSRKAAPTPISNFLCGAKGGWWGPFRRASARDRSRMRGELLWKSIVRSGNVIVGFRSSVLFWCSPPLRPAPTLGRRVGFSQNRFQRWLWCRSAVFFSPPQATFGRASHDHRH